LGISGIKQGIEERRVKTALGWKGWEARGFGMEDFNPKLHASFGESSVPELRNSADKWAAHGAKFVRDM
jgi:hypothetical protein